jgi:hypothetical protein
VSVWLVVLPKGVNPWIVVVMFLFLVLLAGVAMAIQRPRHAEDELRQPTPVPTSTPGSLSASSLKRLVLSLQAARRTGTLQLSAGGRTCSLYFLFGHLFHAASESLTGEAALQDCLTWQDVQYTFDAQAQLPKEETITRPIDQILAA